MKIVKLPRPMRWFWGGLGAYWLADIINPGFFSVAVMALLMIPILIVELYFPARNLDGASMAKQVSQTVNDGIDV